MRLSELLEATVVDTGGDEVGTVNDVRLVQDGPVIGTFGAAFAVEGFIVSRRGAGSYFGFERADVTGPPLVRWFFRALHRNARFVPWEAVARIGDGRIELSVSADELGPVPEL